MIKIRTFFLVVFTAMLFLSACQKNDNTNYPPPEISFIELPGYIYHDTMLSPGQTFNIGIAALSNDINLTNFLIKVETDTIVTVFDTGFNSSVFNIEKTLTKGLNPDEKWIFIIRDRHTESTEISFTTILDTSAQYGEIITLDEIAMGAQNSGENSFFSINNNSTYNLENAYQNQAAIDLVYYYDFIDTDENVIASPGANIDESVFPGQYTLANWTTRNTYRFKTTEVTIEEFNNAQNDSLLLAVYGQAEGKRKAKNLDANMIFAFKGDNGKTGLFLVNSVTGTDQGNVNITIKVQK